MFRNHYDGDCATFSPQGRLHQLEYATEATKQGSAAIGLKSRTHVVLCGVLRKQSELAGPQQKIFEVDEHCGMAIAGLTADGRSICKYVRNECAHHRFTYETPMQLGRLVGSVADKAQVYTQRYGRRPYGVGVLVAGVDRTGTHLYELLPSANFNEYRAHAIGARSQSARTYLERAFETFEGASRDDLLRHAVLSLRESAPSGTELNAKNVSIAVVAGDEPFHLLDEAAVKAVLDTVLMEDE